MKSKKQKLLKFSSTVAIVLSFIPCIMIGAVIGRLSIKNNWGTNGVLLNIFVIMIVSFLLLFLQTIIHELGHLVFGLISKYKFLSFRIGSLTLIKIDGKYKLKSMKIAGTAGQCLLIPPEVEPNKLPITLYLLGGGLFNLISSGIAFGLYILLPKNDFSFFILFVFGAIGISLALKNLIPASMGGIINDGCNIMECNNKNSTSKMAMYYLLKTNALFSQIDNVNDLPKNIKKGIMEFDYTDLTNGTIANLYNFKAILFIASGKYDEAYECFEKLSTTDGVVGIFKYESNCELIYLELIKMLNNFDDKVLCEKYLSSVDKRYDKKLKEYISKVKKEPSKIRLMYAYSLVVEENAEKAKKELANLKKAAANYPNKADANLELDLAKRITELYEKKSIDSVGASASDSAG